MNERDSNKLAAFPARLSYAGPGGEVVETDAELQLRGHWRRQRKNCEFAPIKVDFPKGARAGTVFEEQGDLKLVTHCRRNDEYEQYVLREKLVYDLYGILTPVTLRARPARVTYKETAGKQDSTAKYAFFIENEKKAAARLGAEVLEIKGARWPDVDPAQANLVSLFTYMIGATDWSLVALHNMVLFQNKETGTIWPMVYDFDWTGIVNTRYSFPDYRLPIKSVRERLYRGVCRTPEEWAPTLALFQEKKTALYAVYDALPDLDPRYARQAREYLDDFYKILDDPRRFKQEIIDTCR
jgi:Fe-S-cluster formation regulator IscX/YfhJ